MKIYFCGSIRGGRTDAGLYSRMIGLLKTYGTVLTEHVGDPALTDRGGDGGNEFIWQRDTRWLRECDILIAECSTPSHGVGYEIAYAETLGKPIHLFYGGEDPRRLSAMLAGSPHTAVHYYENEEELMRELASVF